MLNKTTSIVEISQREINIVSGGTLDTLMCVGLGAAFLSFIYTDSLTFESWFIVSAINGATYYAMTRDGQKAFYRAASAFLAQPITEAYKKYRGINGYGNAASKCNCVCNCIYNSTSSS